MEMARYRYLVIGTEMPYISIWGDLSASPKFDRDRYIPEKLSYPPENCMTWHTDGPDSKPLSETAPPRVCRTCENMGYYTNGDGGDGMNMLNLCELGCCVRGIE